MKSWIIQIEVEGLQKFPVSDARRWSTLDRRWRKKKGVSNREDLVAVSQFPTSQSFNVLKSTEMIQNDPEFRQTVMKAMLSLRLCSELKGFRTNTLEDLFAANARNSSVSPFGSIEFLQDRQVL